jgi:putative transposase
MPFCQLYYHLVWATKRRTPLLTAEVEPVIYGFLRGKAVGLGATVFALNGVEDHVHMVVSIPPRIAVARFIGQVKGVASARFNSMGSHTSVFYWQAEYAAFSFDRKRLPNYVAYVSRQKAHHQDQTLIPILERIGDQDEVNVKEASETYEVEDRVWWDAMCAL